MKRRWRAGVRKSLYGLVRCTTVFAGGLDGAAMEGLEAKILAGWRAVVVCVDAILLNLPYRSQDEGDNISIPHHLIIAAIVRGRAQMSSVWMSSSRKRCRAVTRDHMLSLGIL